MKNRKIQLEIHKIKLIYFNIYRFVLYMNKLIQKYSAHYKKLHYKRP